MSRFEDAAGFEQMIAGFFRYVALDSAIQAKLLASGVVIRFTYTEPDATVLVDCSTDEVGIRPGDIESPAEIEMSMTAETAHRFWFGKVNLTKALARREIVARGPIPRILKLLPAIRPAYDLYPQYLQDHGYAEYLIE
jgi:hypothetical protein